MAAAPTPDAGGAPPPDAGGGAAPSASPAQAPASPTQIRLAQLYQACKMLAQQDPTLAPGLGKAAQGIQEAQTALVTSPPPQAAGNTPPY